MFRLFYNTPGWPGVLPLGEAIDIRPRETRRDKNALSSSESRCLEIR